MHFIVLTRAYEYQSQKRFLSLKRIFPDANILLLSLLNNKQVRSILRMTVLIRTIFLHTLRRGVFAICVLIGR